MRDLVAAAFCFVVAIGLPFAIDEQVNALPVPYRFIAWLIFCVVCSALFANGIFFLFARGARHD